MLKLKFLYSIVLRALIAFFSLTGLVAMFGNFGDTAWRLFPTWFLLSTLIYYTLSAIYTYFYGKYLKRPLAPTWQGLTIISGIAVMILKFALVDWYDILLSTNFDSILICLIIPVLAIADWVFFSIKGSFRPIEPFYWLTLPILYLSWTTITALDMPEDSWLRYPLNFLEYQNGDYANLLLTILYSLLTLLGIGFGIFIIDFAASRIYRVVQKRKQSKLDTVAKEKQTSIPQSNKQDKSKTNQQESQKSNKKKQSDAAADVVNTARAIKTKHAKATDSKSKARVKTTEVTDIKTAKVTDIKAKSTKKSDNSVFVIPNTDISDKKAAKKIQIEISEPAPKSKK